MLLAFCFFFARVAKKHYRAPDELALRAGDCITDMSADRTGWWFGKIGSATGMFPANHVIPLRTSNWLVSCSGRRAFGVLHVRGVCSTHAYGVSLKDLVRIWNPLANGSTSWAPDPSFFHGEIPRAEAEALLETPGDFLVRYSPDSCRLILSARDQDSVLHTLVADDHVMSTCAGSARQPG